MTDKVVFLSPERPLARLANACAALAEALEDTVALGPNRAAGPTLQLVRERQG